MGQASIRQRCSADSLTAERNGDIQAVYFDLGDTILSFGRVSKLQLIRKGARYSYDYLAGLGCKLPSFPYYFFRSVLSLNVRCLYSSITGNDFDAYTVLRRIGEKHGYQLSDEQWQEFAWKWYEPLSEQTVFEPDLGETLSKLKKMGLKLGILSNTFVHASSLEKHLQQYGVLDYFDERLYSYQFHFRKPDARIFKIAAERIGTKPEQTMYIGDRLDNDILPTWKLGMQPVLIDAYHNRRAILPTGAKRIEKLAELPNLIESMRKIAPKC